MAAAAPVKGATRQRRRRQRCRAMLSDRSRRCQRWAIDGSTVCATHGGRAPQVKRTARQRLDSMVEPALSAMSLALARVEKTPDIALHPSVVKVACAVLDRAGYPRASKIELQQVEAKLTEEHVAAMVAVLRRACELAGLDIRADAARAAVGQALREWSAKERGEPTPEPASARRGAGATAPPATQAEVAPPSAAGEHPESATAALAEPEPETDPDEPEVMEL